jgi:hypothetical protein
MTELEYAIPTAPDLIDPLVGYRQWRLVGGSLRSVCDETPWRRVQLSARCPSGEHDPDAVPEHACTCGIYAYYDPCPRTASAVTRDLVAGAIVVWGRVELHATGMRAEHARIVGLELPLSYGAKRRAVMEVADRLAVAAVPHRVLKAAALEYGVPLEAPMRPPRPQFRRRACPRSAWMSWITRLWRPVLMQFNERSVASALTVASREEPHQLASCSWENGSSTAIPSSVS